MGWDSRIATRGHHDNGWEIAVSGLGDTWRDGVVHRASKMGAALRIAGSMELIWSRIIPAIDAESLLPCEAREVLLRDRSGFLLYLTKEFSSAPAEERLLRLGAREALVWLNETPQEQGSFWN